jgi:hypothetical protein
MICRRYVGVGTVEEALLVVQLVAVGLVGGVVSSRAVGVGAVGAPAPIEDLFEL